METAKLSQATRFLFFMFLFFGGLYFAKGFLVPLAFAALLSMLLLPLSMRLEAKGWNRALAIIATILMLLVIVGGIIVLLGWQIQSLSQDFSVSEQKITETINKVKRYISNTLGISPQRQEAMLKEQQSSSNGKTGAFVTGIFNGIGGFLTDTILVLVYIFLLSFYRDRLRGFVLKLVPTDDRGKAIATMQQSRQVAQKYISGLGAMIFCLWVLYGIGFSIVGVKHAVFFAILCGLLEIIPFIGNLTGTALTLIMALTQGGDTNMALGILGVYAFVQFFQTYILEPLVVGSEVSINPLFTILIIVLGEMVWGIPGMILAIPLLGITKIIFDHVDALKPYGYLIGADKKESSGGLSQKLKQLLKKK